MSARHTPPTATFHSGNITREAAGAAGSQSVGRLRDSTRERDSR